MANYSTFSALFTAIANAIRSKDGITGSIYPSQFASRINNINTDMASPLIMRTITTYANDDVINVEDYAFADCYSLTTVSFPACTNIGNSAFNTCTSLNNANFPACISIGEYAFNECSLLSEINFPVCTNIGNFAFSGCRSLTTASFPACTIIGNSAFYYCRALSEISFPVCTSIGSWAFYYCISLTTASFPACTTIMSFAFRDCNRLISLYLLGSSVAQLASSAVFQATPIGGYSASAGQYGSIYVPASLLASYQAAANWSYLSSKFVGV